MEKHQKVVWYEGMNLDPQHFQQLDRFHISNLNNQIQSHIGDYWGLLDIAIEEEALNNDQFKLLNCRGIMPDGQYFHIPEIDSLPPAKNFSEDFPSTQENLAVYLTIPAEKTSGMNCQLEESPQNQTLRYKVRYVDLMDDNSNTNSREIGVAHTNFKLKLESESLEDLIYIKIADIHRTTEGGYTLGEKYIFPCLSVNASNIMERLLRRLIELLIARSSSLRDRFSQSRDGKLKIEQDQIPIYMILFSINSFIPLLNQYLTSGKYHPVVLYTTLLSLTGQLTSLSPDIEILSKDLPAYDHSNSYPGFATLEKYIKQLMGEITPAKSYLSIDLERKGETIFVGRVQDSSIMQDSEFFLVCQGDFTESKFTTDLPRKIRIASPEMIKEVLSMATLALPLTVVSKPPTGVPVKTNSYFYKLEKKDEFWKPIEKSRAIVIYIPAEFKTLTIELIAVKIN